MLSYAQLEPTLNFWKLMIFIYVKDFRYLEDADFR